MYKSCILHVFKKLSIYHDISYRYIDTADHADQEALQEDLVRLAEWEDKWGKEFHPQKCSTLSVTRSRSPLRYPFQLKGHTLEVQDTSGLDKDLDQWVFHPLLFHLMSISLHI